MWRWHEEHGLRIFRKISWKANGNWISGDELLTCEHETRRVSSTNLREAGDDFEASEHGYKVLVSHFEGKRLNSPNDLIVRSSDGTIWFTDPDYGVTKRIGHGEEMEQAQNNVFCFDPLTEELATWEWITIIWSGFCICSP